MCKSEEMKKIKMKNFGVIVVVLLFLAGCQSNPTNYTILGDINGLDSGMMYLVEAVNGEAVVVDSATVTEGEFQFSGEAPIPEMYYLRLNETNYFTQFFLENGKINVTADADSLSNAVVSGSKSNDLLREYMATLNDVNSNLLEMQQNYSVAVSSGNTDEADRLNIDMTEASNDFFNYVKNFVTENNSSVVAPFLTLSVLVPQKLDYNELEPIVSTFSPDLDETIYMKNLNSYMDQQSKIAIGAIAPDFTQNDPDGNPVTLSSLRGKYVLIDFWASWCAPCRDENPNVVKNYNKYKDKGFDIIGVSLDQDKDSWLKAIEDDGLTWHHVSDLKYWDNEVSDLYYINEIPSSFLLDKDGRIIAKDLRGDELDEKLAELMP